MSLAEPQRPKPETFDLTAARLEEFDRAHPWFTTRLFAVVFVLVALRMGSEFFSRGGPKEITVGALVGLLFLGFFGLVVCFAMTFMIAFPGGLILDSRARPAATPATHTSSTACGRRYWPRQACPTGSTTRPGTRSPRGS